MAGEDSSRVCKTGSPGFGWLCLARSVLALVVTVIAAIVLVKGMSLVLQFDTSMIQLNVAQSDVFVYRYGMRYAFRFYLEANNPSEVLFISYRNITAQLLKDGTVLAKFHLYPSSLYLSQKEEQEYFVIARPLIDHVSPEAVQKLFKEESGGKIDGAVMVLSGQLFVLDLQRSVATGYEPTNFTCQSVTVKSNVRVPNPSSENYKTECLKG